MWNAHCRVLFSSRVVVMVGVMVILSVRIRFTVSLVSTYAHIFVLFFVVIATLPIH